ncbi:hypothetical protein D3C78_1648620 [compost metagenome]
MNATSARFNHAGCSLDVLLYGGRVTATIGVETSRYRYVYCNLLRHIPLRLQFGSGNKLIVLHLALSCLPQR